MIYGCHSDKAPNRCKSQFVDHSKHIANHPAYWTYKFTRSCQYDNKANDIKCNGCKHEHKDDKL